MPNSVEELPKIPVLFCVLFNGRGIEHEVVRHSQQHHGVGSKIRGVQLCVRDYTVAFVFSVSDLDMLE